MLLTFPELLTSFCCLKTLTPFFTHKWTACPHINQMDGCLWFIAVVRWVNRLKSPAFGALAAGQTSLRKEERVLLGLQWGKGLVDGWPGLASVAKWGVVLSAAREWGGGGGCWNSAAERAESALSLKCSAFRSMILTVLLLTTCLRIIWMFTKNADFWTSFRTHSFRMRFSGWGPETC